MPVDLLEYICHATTALQDVHRKHFQRKEMGSNVLNLNFFFCYCIKVYDLFQGTQEMRRWRRFIKLSPGKLKTYNRLLKMHLERLKEDFPSIVCPSKDRKHPEELVYSLEWPEIKVERADLFVRESIRLI